MKTKFIVISFGVFLIGLIVFIVTQQESPVISTPKVEEKIGKTIEKEQVKMIPQKPEVKVEASAKSQDLGKMPDASDKEAMEQFFNKSFMAWNDKVASLIVNDLKLGQEALDKYSKIRDDFYQSQFAHFQVHTSAEPPGSEDKESQRRLASTGKNFKELLETDHGINFDKDELSPKEDFPKIQKAVQDALQKDSDKFLSNHLKQVKDVMGNEGFKKYEKLKEEFNNEINEEEPLFKI